MSLEHSPVSAQNQSALSNHPFDSESEQDGPIQRSAPPAQLFASSDTGDSEDDEVSFFDSDDYKFLSRTNNESLQQRQDAAQQSQDNENQFFIEGRVSRQVEVTALRDGPRPVTLEPETLVYILYRIEGNRYRIAFDENPGGRPRNRTSAYADADAILPLNGSVPEEEVKLTFDEASGLEQGAGLYQDWSAFVEGSRLAEIVREPFKATFPDGEEFSLETFSSYLFLIGSPVEGREGYFEARVSTYNFQSVFYLHQDDFRLLDGEPLPEGRQPKGQNHSDNSFAVVQQPAPLVSMEDSEQVLENLPVNTSLFIEKVDEYGWLHVRTDAGQTGRVNKRFVHGEPPAPGSTLYRIQSGDNIEGIFQQWLRDNGGQSLVEQGGSQAGDPRYFANVVMQLNNPEGEFEGTSVYLNDDFNLLNLIQNYQQMEVRADYTMWLPSSGHYLSMIGVISPGSIHGNVQHGIKETLDRFWPEGFGLMLDGSLGATFGIPVGLDGEMGLEIVRTGSDELQVRRHFSAWGGADTGVSASAFFGSRQDVRGTEDKKWGVGASAGANARAGVRLYGLQEYSFPMDDRGVIGALTAVSWSDTSPLMQGLYFIGALTQFLPNPQEYFTKQKMQAGLEGNAEAVASAGLRAGTENYASHSGQNPEGNYGDDRAATARPGGFIRNRLVPKLQLAIGGRYDLSASAGLEMEVDPDNPDIMNATWFGEFVSEVHGAGLMAPLFVLIPGGSIGQTSQWSIDQSDPNAEWEEKGNSFKMFTGQLDYYQGPASETEIFMQPGNNILDVVQKLMEQLQTGGMNMNDLFAMIADMKFTNRFNLPLEFGGGHFLSRQLQQGVERLLPREYSNKGFALNGYFTVKYGLRPSLVGQELQNLIDHYRGKWGVDGMMRVFNDLIGWLMNGEENEISQSFSSIAQGLVILDATFRAEAGLSVAAGAAISAGGKGRLQGHLGGGILFEQNITDLTAQILANNFQEFNQQFIMKGEQ